MYVRRISHDSATCLPRAINRFGLSNTGIHGRCPNMGKSSPVPPEMPVIHATPFVEVACRMFLPPVPFPSRRIRRAARLLQPRAYPQSLTQLVFLIAEAKPNKIANNPCAAQFSGDKVARMKDTVGLVFARRVMVN